MTLVEKVASYFQARPNQWIDGKALAEVGGGYGWRTRVSDARRRYALTIENRVRHVEGADGLTFAVSEYRYVPAVPETIGRYDANTWGLR